MPDVRSRSSKVLPLYNRLLGHSRLDPDRAALLTPGQPPLSYLGLFQLVDRTVRRLRRLGIGHCDRVAVVLSNGPEAAAASVAVATGAVCIPLDPKLADQDWQRYLKEFRVDALLINARSGGTARQAASELGIQVVQLVTARNQPAGTFELLTDNAVPPLEMFIPQLEHDAFILPTSGTTSWPKAVPLTHQNICHSSMNTSSALQLSADDRLLSVLPLFHAHGLISGLLSSLCTGSGVILMNRFDAAEFFTLLDEFRPTWYTAVPAIHQSIIREASHHAAIVREHSLRLIRSASAPMPREVIASLENLFGVPVIETYGMTEAASQIASNPLPPGKRKVGSVGIAAGPEVAIVNEADCRLPVDTRGEIAIRGPNVTRGYEGTEVNPGDTWFRTGDLGYMDRDGYIFIQGRAKELINRGGRKIAPQKVEEALLAHPDVVEAAAFPIPHPGLGEDVGAAVVLVPGARVSAEELRLFPLHRGMLAIAETPRLILELDELPRTQTGKLRRTVLAESAEQQAVPINLPGEQPGPEGFLADTEHGLSRIWTEELGIDQISRHDDFFLLGGDSLLSVRLANRVLEEFGYPLSLRALFENPTIAQLAQNIVGHCKTSTPADQASVTVERFTNGPARLTVAQESILVCVQGLESFPTHNIPFMFRLLGELDTAAFGRALNHIISRHEALRTVFRHHDGQVDSSVAPMHGARIEVETEDWSIIPLEHRAGFATSVAHDLSWMPFDTSHAPLFRLRLLQFSDKETILVMVFHHIISDGWSMEILFREISSFYSAFAIGSIPEPDEPDYQFSDFARWQEDWCGGEEAGRQLEYWKDRLENPVSLFSAIDRQRRSHAGFSMGRTSFRIAHDATDRLTLEARRSDATLFMALLAGLKLALQAMFGCNDICVATPMANRSRPFASGIFGLIENTTVIRTRLVPDMSFDVALEMVRESILDAHQYQDFPFERLVPALEDAETLDTVPLYEVFFSFTRRFGRDLSFPRVSVQSFGNLEEQARPVFPVDRTKIMITLVETDELIQGLCIYDESLIDSAKMWELIDHFANFLNIKIYN